MDINNKMLEDLASELGLPNQNDVGMKQAERKAESYKNKSDDELIQEILKLKGAMQNDKATYNKQMGTLKALRGVMQGEQKARLEKIITLLES